MVAALQERGKEVWVDVEGVRDAEVFPEALRQAVNGGYRDLAWIEIDHDLDPLRSRDDYKALINQIKAKGALPRQLEEAAAKP